MSAFQPIDPDDEIIPVGETPPAAAPGAGPHMWTKEQEQQLVEFMKTAKTPEDLVEFSRNLGKENGVMIPLEGSGGAQDLLSFRDKNQGTVSNHFAIPDFAKGEVQPEQGGLEPVAAGDQVDYGTLSGLSPDEIKAKYEGNPEAEMLRQAIEKSGPLGVITDPLARHGFTGGLDAEVTGLAGAGISAFLHPLKTFQSGGANVVDAYHDGRKELLSRLDYLKMVHPNTAAVTEIAGALANPIGAEAKGLKGLAKVGAGYGAISGFEEGDGTVGERLTEGAKRMAIGAVAAPALGMAIKAPGAVKNLLPGNREASPLTQAFDRQAIDPMAAYVGGTGAQMATGVAHMTLGGIPLSEAAQNTIAQARTARDRIAAGMGWVKDGMGVGAAARKGSEKWIDTTEGKASAFYHAIPIAGETPATLANTKQTLVALNEGLTSNPELSAMISDPRLKGFQAALEGRTENVPTGLLDASGKPITRPVQKGGGLSWQDLKAFRSLIGEKMNGLVLQSDTSQKALGGLYGALSKDMEATATAQGPGALAAFRRANTYWRARQTRIENVIKPIIGDKGDGGPQAAFNQILSWSSNRGETVRVAQLMRSLPDDEAATVRASIFSRLGNAKAGQQNWEGTEFSPSTFATMWHNMDPAARAAMFPGKQYRQDIDDILQISHAMRDSGKYANNSKTALGVNAFGHLSALVGAPLATISVAAGEFGAGKLLASPKFARWLASLPKKPNAPAVLQHISQLNSVAAAQPAIANEVHLLQERLAGFFTSPSTSIAAEDINDSGQAPEQK